MMSPAEMEVVGNAALTDEEVEFLAKLKKKEMTHMGETIPLSPNK